MLIILLVTLSGGIYIIWFSQNHNFMMRICFCFRIWRKVFKSNNSVYLAGKNYEENYWSSLSFQLVVLLPLFILTVIFFFGFFGLHASQNCWIYPLSWNEILIYVTCFLKGVPHELYFDWHCSPCITLLFITLWSATVTLTIKMSKLGNSS